MTNKTSKPCREWLETLASPYREQALDNWRKYEGLVKFNSVLDLRTALKLSFYWNTTPQGYDYWEQVCYYPIIIDIPKKHPIYLHKFSSIKFNRF